MQEMAKVKAFLEDDNSWWKILKNRSVSCCQQKVPHLHGHLDGSSVTLMLLEEDTDEVRLSDVSFPPFFLISFLIGNAINLRLSEKVPSADRQIGRSADRQIPARLTTNRRLTLIECAVPLRHRSRFQVPRNFTSKKRSDPCDVPASSKESMRNDYAERCASSSKEDVDNLSLSSCSAKSTLR